MAIMYILDKKRKTPKKLMRECAIVKKNERRRKTEKNKLPVRKVRKGTYKSYMQTPSIKER